MRKIFSPRVFWCKKCKTNHKRYKWSDDLTLESCTVCLSIMEEIQENDESFSIRKHKKGRGNKEKTKRRIGHFKEEILPTLSKQDQRYFQRKHGK